MTVNGIIFYIVAASIVATTVVAITRRNIVHVIVYLIFSFFGTAILFYLFGAPLLSALEVIIYAGAIMVLFLFVVMMIRMETNEELLFPLTQWVPAVLFGLIYLGAGAVAITASPAARVSLETLYAAPREFGVYVYGRQWFNVEVISLLLLVALMGALCLGARNKGKTASPDKEEDHVS